MGINSVADAADKELDMQLRKLAAAMLVMGVTAGLAHAEDAAPAAGWRRNRRRGPQDRCN